MFSNMTVNDVLSEVLSKHGIDHDLDLTGTYTVRDYCTQYRETDFAFISRLMEEEGIYYYFNHSAGGTRWCSPTTPTDTPRPPPAPRSSSGPRSSRSRIP
ncbi:MAG: contractile injection system protein, VgrG/Pvc8 family [Gemmatimonadales bacterium]